MLDRDALCCEKQALISGKPISSTYGIPLEIRCRSISDKTARVPEPARFRASFSVKKPYTTADPPGSANVTERLQCSGGRLPSDGKDGLRERHLPVDVIWKDVAMFQEERGRSRRWSKQEEEYLLARWLAGDRLAAIAEVLSRTSQSCMNRITKLGIHRGQIAVSKKRKSKLPTAFPGPEIEVPKPAKRTRKDYRTRKNSDQGSDMIG